MEMQSVLDGLGTAVAVPIGLAVAIPAAAVLCGVVIGRRRRREGKAEAFLQAELVRVQRMNAELKRERDRLKGETERTRRRAKMRHRMAVPA